MSVLTTAVLKCVPAAAAGITVTSGGSAWGNGSWVELIASAAADLAITGLVVLPAGGAQFEIEIGVGAIDAVRSRGAASAQ